MLIVQLVLFVIGTLLNKPDIEGAKATTFEDAGFPDPDPRKKQPIGWGTVRYGGLHVMDFVDYRFEEVKKKVKTSPFSSKRVVVAHNYFVTMALGIARASSAAAYTLRKVYWEDELLDQNIVAPLVGGFGLTISKPDFLGGEEEGGGLSGVLRFYGGLLNQDIDPTLESFHAADESPAYRAIAYVVLEDFEIGESPNIKPIQFILSRFPNQLGLTSQVLLFGPANLDINPVAFIADLLLDGDYGLSKSFADLNSTELTATAVALELEDPELGMSVKWPTNAAIKKLFNLAQEHADGIVTFFDGQWTFLLSRFDYTVGSLPVFDDSTNSKLIRWSRTDPGEVINTIELNYFDRLLARRPSPIFVQDSANFERLGRNRSMTLDFPGCYDPDVAQFIAARELHARGASLATIEIEVDRSAFNLLPSQVFVYNNDTLGIVQIVVRASEIGLGTPKNRTIRLRGIEDVFGVGSTLINPPQTVPPPISQAPQVFTQVEHADMPYLFALVDPDAGSPGLQHKPIAWPIKPQGNSIRWRNESRVSPAAFEFQEEWSFGPSGVLSVALDEGTIDSLATLIITGVQESGLIDLARTLNEIQNFYLGHIMIFSSISSSEPEILAYETAVIVGSTVTLSVVHRGMMDTVQKMAASGDRVVFHDGQGTTITDNYPSTALVDSRYFNITSQGESGVSATFSDQMRNRVNRPFPGADFQINAVRYPDSPVLMVPVTIIPDGDITLTWADRDRLDDVSLFHDEPGVTMEAGNEYRLQIFDSFTGGNLLRTETIAAGVETFVYTQASQATDGGPFEFYEFILRAHATGAPTGVFNIIDVARSIRFEGGIVSGEFADDEYRRLILTDANLDLYFPLDERSKTVPVVETQTMLATTRNGGVGPGSFPVVGDFNSVNSGFDGIAGTFLEAADTAFWDFSTQLWTVVLHFAIGEDDADQVLMLRENGINANDPFRIYVDTTGNLIVEIRTASGSVTPDSAFDSSTFLTAERFDDGAPHMLEVDHTTNAVLGIRIDGVFIGVSDATFTVPFANNEVMNIGGPGGSAFGGSARGVIGHVQIYDTPLNGPGTRPLWRAGRRDHPFDVMLRLIYGTEPAGDLDGYWKLNDVTANAVTDWTENNIATPVASPVGRSGGFLAGVQANHAYVSSMDFNGSTQYLDIGTSTGLSSHTFGGIFGWFNSTLVATGAIFSGADTANGQNQSFLVLLNATGELRLLVRVNTSANQYELETTPTFDDGVDHWFFIDKPADGTVPTIWVDGVPYSDARGNATETVVGTGANTDWLDEVRSAAGGDASMRFSIGVRILVASQDLHFDGRLGEIGIIGDVATSAADIARLYATQIGAFRSSSDVLLDEDLHHLFEIDTFGAVDDVMDNMGGVTAAWVNTGTGELVDQLPLAMDDLLPSVRIPRDGSLASALHARFNERAFLEGPKGLQNFHDHGAFFQAMHEALANGMVFSNFDNANTALNYYFETDTANAARMDKFLPANLWLLTVDDQMARGQVNAFGYREELIGGGSPPANTAVGERNQMWNRREAIYDTLDDVVTGDNDPDLVEIYGGGVDVDDAMIAAWGGQLTDNTRNFGGLLNRIAMWARPPSRRRLLLNTLRSTGWHELPLYIRSLEPFLYWRFNDGSTATVIKDFSENAKLGTISGVDVVLSGIQANLWSERQGFYEGNRTGASADCWIGIDGSTKVPNDLTTYPFQVGGWMRPDDDASGFDNIVICWGDIGSESRLVLSARADTDVFSITVENNGTQFGPTATSAFGDGGLGDIFRFVIFNFTTSTNCDVYVGGEFFESITLGAAVSGWTPDRFRLQAQAFNSGDPNSVFNGSHHDFFVTTAPTTMTAAEVRELYIKNFIPAFDMVSEASSPIASWKLNEHEVANRYRNNVRDSAGHIIVGDGTGELQAQAGILPLYADNCVDFDGTGQIDTNWQEYPTGSGNRTLEGWVEGGFIGTWFSMGTNTDLQALKVNIAANGDLEVDIRGTGEQLTFTTTGIDAGTEHLVALELDGTTLNDFRLWVDGVEITTTSGGSASTVNTVQTLDLFLGSDVTDLAGADATGKASRFAIFNTALPAVELERHAAVGGIAL